MLTRADSTGCLSQLQAVSRAPKRRIGGSGPPACEQLTLHRASCASDVPLWLSRPPHQCQLPLPSPFRVFNGLGPARRCLQPLLHHECPTNDTRPCAGKVRLHAPKRRIGGAGPSACNPACLSFGLSVVNFPSGPSEPQNHGFGAFPEKTARQEGEIPNPSSFLGRFSLAESRAGKLALSVPDVLDRPCQAVQQTIPSCMVAAAVALGLAGAVMLVAALCICLGVLYLQLLFLLRSAVCCDVGHPSTSGCPLHCRIVCVGLLPTTPFVCAGS